MLENENKKIKMKILKLSEEKMELKGRLCSEQYSKKENLIISGIIQKENEYLRAVILNLGNKLQVPIQNADISYTQRLPSKSTHPAIMAKVK